MQLHCLAAHVKTDVITKSLVRLLHQSNGRHVYGYCGRFREDAEH